MHRPPRPTLGQTPGPRGPMTVAEVLQLAGLLAAQARNRRARTCRSLRMRGGF